MARGNETAGRKTGVDSWNESEGIAARRAASTASARQKRATAEKRRRGFLLGALCVLLVACVWCFWPLNERIARGLWLKGGTQVTMAVAPDGNNEVTASELSSAAATIRSRINAVGVSEASVSVVGTDQIRIDLPWNVDAEAIAESVGGTGVLEFVRVDEIGDADALAKVNAGTENVELQEGTYAAFMDGSSVSSTTVTEVGSGVYAITIVFDDEGAQTFADVTRELAESSGNIAIVVDGRVVAAPGVSEEITGGMVSISGDFTAQEANALKAVLDSGALSVQLSYEGSEEIGPLVGTAGLWALVAVPCAVIVGATAFAFARYRKLAVIVGGCMVVYALSLLGLMALASRLDMFVLTMPGVASGAVAGAITVVAVWLMVDRFHTEAVGGRTIKGSAIMAVREGMRPLGLPVAGAFVVSCVLLLVPLAAARDFGLVFVFGVVCGLVAVYWYAVTLLQLLASGAIQANPGAWGVAGKRDASNSSLSGQTSNS